MFISRSQVVCLLLLLSSISALHHEVLGARHLKEKVKNLEKPQVWKKSSSAEDGGIFATVKREVPSCPDPLHNR
jgi:hypothetical protein